MVENKTFKKEQMTETLTDPIPVRSSSYRRLAV